MTRTKREQTNRYQRPLFAVPLPHIVLVGSILTAIHYGLILAGPLDFAILRRLSMCHPVAYATIWLFYIGIVELSLKWFRAFRQTRLVRRSAAALRRLVDEGCEVVPAHRVDWLVDSWRAEPEATRESWLGQRVTQSLQLQQNRGRRHQLESDLTSLADYAADQQYESYSLVRIIHWAMPMLGFLGTVLGISVTLGQLDMQRLASQDQAAMDQLTGGLYVAFDTTAIALILTITSMFVQFAVSRVELALLDRLNHETERSLVGFLSEDLYDATDTLLAPMRDMTEELLKGVRELVVEQANLWARSIAESQKQWAEWTDKLANELDMQSTHALSEALAKHLSGLETVHEKSTVQLESRMHQWQTTLSEQTRALHAHQKDVVQQTEILNRLIESTTELRKLEEFTSMSVHQRNADQVERLDQTSQRIELATQCVAEAVAKLAISLERAGILRASPQKPRAARAASNDGDETTILPFDSDLDPTAIRPSDHAMPRGKAA